MRGTNVLKNSCNSFGACGDVFKTPQPKLKGNKTLKPSICWETDWSIPSPTFLPYFY